MGRLEAQLASLRKLREELVASYGEAYVAGIESDARECIFNPDGKRRSKPVAHYFALGFRRDKADADRYVTLFISSDFDQAKVTGDWDQAFVRQGC